MADPAVVTASCSTRLFLITRGFVPDYPMPAFLKNRVDVPDNPTAGPNFANLSTGCDVFGSLLKHSVPDNPTRSDQASER
jgi:hypothetical protein